MTRRIEFTVPDEIGEAYDQARGIAPMATWIKVTLAEALDSNAYPSGAGLDRALDSGPEPKPAPRTSLAAKRGVRPIPKTGK